MASLSADTVVQKVSAGSKAEWPVDVSSLGSEVKISFSITAGPEEDAPDWEVVLKDSSGEELWGSYDNLPSVDVDVVGSNARRLVLSAECPRGARYGDTVEIALTADSDGTQDVATFKAVATKSIMILKTQVDQENAVASAMWDKYKRMVNAGSTEGMDFYAVLSPDGLRGYVFVEGMNTNRLSDEVRDIKKAKNFVKEGVGVTDRRDKNDMKNGEVSIEDVSPYLVPVSAVVGIVEGDIVELVNGPFKGEKARVQQIDQSKEEITVELIEAMVPIPVTVKGDSVRIIEKER